MFNNLHEQLELRIKKDTVVYFHGGKETTFSKIGVSRLLAN